LRGAKRRSNPGHKFAPSNEIASSLRSSHNNVRMTRAPPIEGCCDGPALEVALPLQ
jgi:hypothetical protein